MITWICIALTWAALIATWRLDWLTQRLRRQWNIGETRDVSVLISDAFRVASGTDGKIYVLLRARNTWVAARILPDDADTVANAIRDAGRDQKTAAAAAHAKAN